MSLDALALKNLFLSCEFQIHPLFIISPLLDNPARRVGFCINLLALPTFIYLQHSKKNNNKKKWQMPILEGELDNLELIEL